jgi:murein DD-endopeptidase MepM/ murein hydrolase activator NlpD
MLRRALPSLFCVFALLTPAYSQDVFVPRELKAQPAHPPKESKAETKSEKPKEIVRKPEPVTDSKPAKDEATKKVAKTEAPAEKPEKAPAKEKSVAAKAPAPADDIVTIKVQKPTVAKDPATPKTVAKVEPPKEKKEKTTAAKKESDDDLPTIKVEKAATAKNESVKVEAVTSKSEKPSVKDHPATVAASKTLRDDKIPAKETKAPKTEQPKPEVVIAKTEKPAPVKEKAKPAIKPQPTKSEAFIAKNEPAAPAEGPSKLLAAKTDIVSVPSQKDPPQISPAMTTSLDTGLTRIADGFDFPVGKPEAEGYYKARGFRPGGHVGEDWDGVRGGDTDLGDPIYSIGDGIVVFARDVHLGWGNVVIVRHAYRDGGNVKYIDALYGHLNTMLVGRGQRVSRGQQIATMGTAHGQYDAHLHFEIRKNLEIGMSRSKFQKDFSNYYDPTQFINSHRHLSGGGANYKVAMNTFTWDWTYHFDKNRDFGSRRRSTSQSSAALRAALTSNH